MRIFYLSHGFVVSDPRVRRDSLSCSINTYVSLMGHHPTVNGFLFGVETPGLWFFFFLCSIQYSRAWPQTRDKEVASNH